MNAWYYVCCEQFSNVNCNREDTDQVVYVAHQFIYSE